MSEASGDNPRRGSRIALLICWLAAISLAAPAGHSFSATSIFAPASTPAQSIFDLSMFVLAITGAIFVVVFALLAYAVVKFRKKGATANHEPAQVYGSTQVELAWTVIPILIVVILFLTTARVIAGIQNAIQPANAMEVTVIGHQFWWEYQYPSLKVVTANELHLPVGEPVFLKLLSADTDHSFWVPRLGGKTDLIPNHPNSMWMDPRETGLYLGQCAQYCGTQHAKMLLRVYVQTREEFDRWIQQQQQPAHPGNAISDGQRVFEGLSCVNCHTVAGTAAKGRFGPDLTHLMSRETIASGAAPNTPENLHGWIKDPSVIKPGSLMPAMGLSDQELDALTAYLETLR